MKRRASVDVYKDKAGQFRWRLRARNGKIIASSSEGYASKRNVMRAARAVWRLLVDSAPIVDCTL